MCRRAWILASLAACAACRYGFTEVAGDGGPADSPPDGALGDDAVSLDDTACDELTGTLMCESFEGATLMTNRRAIAPSTVAIEAGRAYRGARAIHAHTTRAYEAAWLFAAGPLGDVSDGDLYARMYLFQPATAAPQLGPLHLVTTTAPNHGTIFRTRDTGTAVYVGEPDRAGASAVLVPRDRWSCIQLHVAIADAGGVVESWVDGAPAARLDDVDTLPPGGYANVHAGLYTDGPEVVTVDVWIDELVVSRAPIPCD